MNRGPFSEASFTSFSRVSNETTITSATAHIIPSSGTKDTAKSKKQKKRGNGIYEYIPVDLS
jgi:hypothetical protein